MQSLTFKKFKSQITSLSYIYLYTSHCIHHFFRSIYADHNLKCYSRLYKYFVLKILFTAACTCQTGVIRPGAREVRRGAFGRVPRPEAYIRVVRRGASGPDHIKSCVMPGDRRRWTVKAQTIRDRAESKCWIRLSSKNSIH